MAKTKEELMKLKKEYDTLNSKLKELSEEELKLVIGGIDRSRTVNIPVPVPQNLGNSITFTVYIDGQLKSSLTKTVDPIIKIVNFTFTGTIGCSSIKIKANNIDYKNYTVNFDSGTYTE